MLPGSLSWHLQRKRLARNTDKCTRFNSKKKRPAFAFLASRMPQQAGSLAHPGPAALWRLLSLQALVACFPCLTCFFSVPCFRWWLLPSCVMPDRGKSTSAARRSGCGTRDHHRLWLNADICGVLCSAVVWAIICSCLYWILSVVLPAWLGWGVLGWMNAVGYSGVSAMALLCHARGPLAQNCLKGSQSHGMHTTASIALR